MNQDVPQPTTATLSPRRGRAAPCSGRVSAACRQQAACEAISTVVRDGPVMAM